MLTNQLTYIYTQRSLQCCHIAILSTVHPIFWTQSSSQKQNRWNPIITKGVVLFEGRLSRLQHLFSAAKPREMNHRLIWALRRGKGQTLALGLRLFRTSPCANPQSVAQSDLSGIRVIHAARLSGIEMKSHTVKVKNPFCRRENTRATYLNSSAVRCSSLYPEAKSSGGLGGDSVYRLCTFHELKLLLVNLKRSIRSLRPCCVLIILSDRMACERCLLPPRAVGNSIFLLADRYETCECLISPGGDNDMATSQSA